MEEGDRNWQDHRAVEAPKRRRLFISAQGMAFLGLFSASTIAR